MATMTARTIAGQHVCPAGVGEGEHRGTIPARLLACEVLAMRHWVIVHSEPFPSRRVMWTLPALDWTPVCLLHCGPYGVIEHDHCVGLYGDEITVLNSARTLSTWDVDRRPNVDLNNINTPPSRSSSSSTPRSMYFLNS